MGKQYHIDWQKQRDDYIPDQRHIDIAKNFLGRLSDPIRVFFGGGRGSGEFISGVHIIQHLSQTLNYRGVVEIIAPNFLNNKQFPLKRILQLYNVEHLFKRDVLKTTLMDGLQVHFYDLDYYKKYQRHFLEVELAIFPGMLDSTQLSLYAWYEYLNGAAYSFANKLTDVAKAKRALYFNPFTQALVNQFMNYGFIMQLKHKQHQKDFPSLALSYPIQQPSPATVDNEVGRIKLYNRELGKTLQRLIAEHRAGQDMTFSIYGVHVLKNPEYSLFNLIYAAQYHANELDDTKPFRVLIMSPISDASWNKLSAMFQKNINKFNLSAVMSHEKYGSYKTIILHALDTLPKEIIFIDITQNQTLPHLSSNHTEIIRMPYLSHIVFAELYPSTVAPVYEGANTAKLLANLGKWGLPCTKPILGWGRGSSLISSKITDADQLPEKLREVSLFICSLSFTTLWRNTTPAEKIGPFMELCRQLPRPSLAPGDDRVSKAIALISEQKFCSQLSTADPEFNLCQFQEILQHPQALIYFAGIAASTGCKGIIYGTIEQVFKKILENYLSKPFAFHTARYGQLIGRGMMEGDWAPAGLVFSNVIARNVSDGDFLVMSIWLIEFLVALAAAVKKYNFPYLNHLINSLMFLSTLAPRLVNIDFPSFCIIAMPLLLIFLISFNVGEHIGETCYHVVQTAVRKPRCPKHTDTAILPLANNDTSFFGNFLNSNVFRRRNTVNYENYQQNCP